MFSTITPSVAEFTFLGVRSVVVIAVAFIAAALASPAGRTARAGNPVLDENKQQGTTQWDRIYLSGVYIEGYASSQSVTPGDQLAFHVSTKPAARYRIEFYRLGWYASDGARLVACLPGCTAEEQGAAQPVPAPDPTTGEVRADWPVTDTIVVPPDWTTGYYLAEIVVTSGRFTGQGKRIPFIVRPVPSSTPSQVLVVAPVNTWEAYNDWGGNSLYVGTTGHPAFKVSFDRPGVSDLSGLQWEYPLVRFLEREGYDVSYTTDVDVDRDPAELLRHRLVVVPGHSEYWSHGMRAAFDRAKAAGTNLFFAGANDGYWQIRYGDDSRTIVGYKELASRDPSPDPQLKTTRFRDLTTPDPECELTGVAYQPGSWGIPSQDYPVNPFALSDPWFGGTNFTATTTLHGLMGGEWDGATPGCVKVPETILFAFDGSSVGKPPADAVRYVASSGAEVFATGSHQFSWGLDSDPYTPPGLADPGLQQFMRNALADLTRPAAPFHIRVARSATAFRLSVTRNADPRVKDVVVYEHAGRALFDPDGSGAGAALVCKTRQTTCTVSAPGGGSYRFAAVAVDAWGRSRPTFSGVVAPEKP
jgi:hypothetical protein